MVCGNVIKRSSVRPSVCLSRRSTAAATSGGFAAEVGRGQQISIDSYCCRATCGPRQFGSDCEGVQHTCYSCRWCDLIWSIDTNYAAEDDRKLPSTSIVAVEVPRAPADQDVAAAAGGEDEEKDAEDGEQDSDEAASRLVEITQTRLVPHIHVETFTGWLACHVAKTAKLPLCGPL